MSNSLRRFFKNILTDNHTKVPPLDFDNDKVLKTFHDAVHTTVAAMTPITVSDGHNTYVVDGVAGITVDAFADVNHNDGTAAYDGMLDEARVAIEHWCIDKNLLNTMRVGDYFLRLNSRNIDPLEFFVKHLQSRGDVVHMPEILTTDTSRLVEEYKGITRLIALQTQAKMDDR